MKTAYQKALEQAQADLAALLQKKQEIERRIINLRQTVVSLTALCEQTGALDDSARELTERIAEYESLSAAVWDALQDSSVPLTPTEIRDNIVKMGVDLSEYSSAMSAIHSVLKRFVENDQVMQTTVDGKTAYKYLTFSDRIARATKQGRRTRLHALMALAGKPLDEPIVKKEKP